MNLRLSVAACGLALLTLVDVTRGAVATFTPASGDYATAGNWSTATIPGNGNNDEPRIGVGATRAATYSTATSYTTTSRTLIGFMAGGNGTLTMSGSAGTLTFGGNTFTSANYAAAGRHCHIIVVFRSAKDRTFAERKATILGGCGIRGRGWRHGPFGRAGRHVQDLGRRVPARGGQRRHLQRHRADQRHGDRGRGRGDHRGQRQRRQYRLDQRLGQRPAEDEPAARGQQQRRVARRHRLARRLGQRRGEHARGRRRPSGFSSAPAPPARATPPSRFPAAAW